MRTTSSGTDTDDQDHFRRETVRRRAQGMTLPQALRALHGARRDGAGAVEKSEWARIGRLLLDRPTGTRYSPRMDRRVQTELAIAAHRRTADAQAERAARAAEADGALGEDEVSPRQALEALADAFDAATLVGRLTPWDIDTLRALADDSPLTAVLLAAWLRRAYVAGLEQLWETC
ncbi:hypothetical protein [Streptacidiphilus melanogenes]|uniref:hypothetical protein n=1 Tax=Streptacidiphilus melanogenes TaxID=411235 RepID=UPI0012699EF9|nr:hypothetical protein [Streptacidiphilus melanogenes]